MIERDARIASLSAELQDVRLQRDRAVIASKEKEETIVRLQQMNRDLQTAMQHMNEVREGGPYVVHDEGPHDRVFNHRLTYRLHYHEPGVVDHDQYQEYWEQIARKNFSTAAIAIKMYAEQTLKSIRETCEYLDVSAHLSIVQEELIPD